MSKIIASILAFVVAFYFYRYYSLSKLSYLLGIAVGFTFIAVSAVFLAIDVLLESNMELFNVIFWLRLVSLSYGFSLLAASYHYKHRETEGIPSLIRIGALSAIPVMIMIGIVVIAPPALNLPPYNDVDEYFRIFNLVMLAYVFKNALGSIIERGRKGFMYIPAAYAILWLGQYSAFIYNVDGSIVAFIAQHTIKIIALTLFVIVLSQVTRGRKVASTGVDT